jgi:hypothetical protein
MILKEFKLFGINTSKTVDSRGFRLPKNGATFVTGERRHGEALVWATESTERLVECSFGGRIDDWLQKGLTPPGRVPEMPEAGGINSGVSYGYFS